MKPEQNPIAVVRGEGESVQSLFAAMARKWQSDGLRVAGLVAEPHALPDRSCTAGILRNVASGEPFAMYLETAPVGTSCHLDADHVEAACTSVLDQVRDADIVVLSKFGKLEAQGKGLWPAFRASREAGKPILTSVSSKHEDAWQAFAPDADLIDADEAALAAWRTHTG